MGSAPAGGPALPTNIVAESSQDLGLDKSSLSVRGANNVRVYDAVPTEPYILLETWDSHFDYLLNSVTDRKIEKKKHLVEVRDWAGRCGANAVIVMFPDQTRQYVRAFAIYCP